MHDQVRLSTGSESCNKMETIGATIEAGKFCGERERAWRGRRRGGGRECGERVMRKGEVRMEGGGKGREGEERGKGRGIRTWSRHADMHVTLNLVSTHSGSPVVQTSWPAISQSHGLRKHPETCTNEAKQQWTNESVLSSGP